MAFVLMGAPAGQHDFNADAPHVGSSRLRDSVQRHLMMKDIERIVFLLRYDKFLPYTGVIQLTPVIGRADCSHHVDVRVVDIAALVARVGQGRRCRVRRAAETVLSIHAEEEVSNPFQVSGIVVRIGPNLAEWPFFHGRRDIAASSRFSFRRDPDLHAHQFHGGRQGVDEQGERLPRCGGAYARRCEPGGG